MARSDWLRSGLRREAVAAADPVGDWRQARTEPDRRRDRRRGQGAGRPRRGGRRAADYARADSRHRGSGWLSLVEQAVVVVLVEAKVIADAVPQPQQQPELAVFAAGLVIRPGGNA